MVGIGMGVSPVLVRKPKPLKAFVTHRPLVLQKSKSIDGGGGGGGVRNLRREANGRGQSFWGVGAYKMTSSLQRSIALGWGGAKAAGGGAKGAGGSAEQHGPRVHKPPVCEFKQTSPSEMSKASFAEKRGPAAENLAAPVPQSLQAAQSF